MRKAIVLIIIGSFIGVSCIPVLSSEVSQIKLQMKTILVDDEGDGDYTSIQDAIDNAHIHDIIEVFSGTYYENIIVNKPYLFLTGMDSELGSGNDTGKPILDGKGTNTTAIHVIADYTSLSGFLIKNYNSTDNIGGGTGMKIESNFTTISDNFITNCDYAIYILTRDNTLFRNELNGGAFLIIEENSSNNEIYKNSLSNSVIAFGSFGSSNTNFTNNTLDTVEGGICVVNDMYINIQNNSINHTLLGLLIGSSKNIAVSDNIIFSSGWSTLSIMSLESHFNLIYHNNLNGAIGSIYLDNSTHNTIVSNDFGSATPGLLINSFPNYWNDNYFPNWRGRLPYPIYGTKTIYSFHIPWINFDWHPAKQPHFPIDGYLLKKKISMNVGMDWRQFVNPLLRELMG